MANVYVVTNELGTEEFTALSKVAAFLGEKKITKADIEAGKYPMITIAEATTEEPTTDLDADKAEYKEAMAKEEAKQEAKAFLDKHVEVIVVGDAPKVEPLVEPDTVEDEPTTDEVVEDEPTVDPEPTTDEVDPEPEATDEVATDKEVEEPELDEHTKMVLDKIGKAINDTPEDNEELFDSLCNLEDAINDGTPLTDIQADLLTKILTGTPLTNTSTEDTEDVPTGDTDPENDYPEVGELKDEKAFKKYVKGLDDASVQEWATLEGVEWKPNEHAAINRMRMVMALKALHFPSTAPKKSKKSKSKYASYSTEELVSMALENDVEVPDDKGDMRICRMYTIMALRKAGIIE